MRKAVSKEDRALIRELIAEHDRRRKAWADLTFARIAEKMGVHQRTVWRIADEVRI